MITRQINPFFSPTFLTLSINISFLHFKTFKIQFHWVPPLNHAVVCKMYIYRANMTLPSLLTYISFFYGKFANFWYIMCFFPI